MKIDLLIFDCDGVLIDSEVINHQTGIDEILRYGGNPPTLEESIKTITGLSEQEILQLLRKKYLASVSDDFVANSEKKVAATYQTKLQTIKDIDIVLNYLDTYRILKCVASNGAINRVVSSLKITKLCQFFQQNHIYSASMVAFGKPAPDLFLHAAEQMQVKPQNCLVVEDSVAGITAAKAAKMPVVGFLGGSHATYSWYQEQMHAVAPNYIAHSAHELLAILKNLKTTPVAFEPK